MRYLGLVIFLCLFTGAAWPPDGVPVCGQAGAQLEPALAEDGDGGAWVAWRDERSSLTGADIYARHVDKNGVTLGGAGGIPVCVASGAQTAPTIIPDGTGGCVIAWTDARNNLTGPDVFAQRLDAAGHALWPTNGTGAMVTFGEQSAPRLLADNFGHYLVAWQDARSGGSNFDIYLQRLDGDGLPTWNPVGLRLCGAAGHQVRPALLDDGANGFFVAWQDHRNGQDDDIYAQRLSVNALPLWAADGVPVCAAPGDQQPSTSANWLATDGAGGCYLAWTDHRDAARPAAFLQRLQAGGARATGWPLNGLAVCAAAGGQSEPGVVADGLSGALVAWLDARGGTFDGCYMGRRTSAGAVYPGWPVDGLSLTTRPGAKSALALVPDGQRGARVAWVVGSLPGGDIDGQWVSTLGTRLGPAAGIPLCAAAGGQRGLALAATTDGDALLAWSDQRAYVATGADLYAHRFVGALGNLDAESSVAGFAAAVIPSDAPNGGPGGAVVPPVLPGNAPNSWLNAAFLVAGPGPLPAWQGALRLDGVPLLTTAFGEALPTGPVVQPNLGPFIVRGGRHTLSLALDTGATAGENDEQDNEFSAQWVWSPQPLTPDEPLSRPGPPAPGALAEPNCDGYSFAPAAGTAWVVGLAGRSELSDVNLLVYDDYTGSGAGFSHRRAQSLEAVSATDYIVGLRDSTPRVIYPAILRGGGTGHATGGGDVVIEAVDARGRSATQLPMVWAAQDLPPDHLVRIYEIRLEAGQGYDFRLLRERGQADLELALFGGGAVITARSGAKAFSVPLDDVSDVLSYTPTQTDWYALVVARRFGSELELEDVYSLYAFSGVVGVGEPPAAAAGLALRVPNPARGRVDLALTLPVAGPLRVEIFDVRGRLVRRLLDTPAAAAGPLSLGWDGRDERGAPAASGVFHARVTSAAGALERTFVRLR